MTSYLLLRNNKESGPFSLDQLVSMGLKAYDLVWVNGKSAAWRYPGEIKELQDFAPPVEEQPFDRFYKKSTENTIETANEVKEKEIQPIKETIPEFKPAKSVFVTLPGNVKKKEQNVTPQTKDDPYQQYQPSFQAQAETVVAKTITIKENPIAAEVKYSQPLDEIKEMYVKTLMERKQKIASKAMLLQLSKKAAVVLAIIAVGVAIGFAMKSGRSSKTITDNNPVAALTNPVANETESINSGDEVNSQVIQDDQTIVNTNPPAEPHEYIQQNQPQTQIPEKKQTILPGEEVPITKKEKPIVRREENENNNPANQQPYEAVDINSRTGERTRKMRDNNAVSEESASVTQQTTDEKPKAVFKTGSLSKLVSVSSNDYTIVAFGGIRNLHLTVNNDSKYLLDNVTVELQYLKPSEQPLKTETVQFRSISPGGSSTIRIPDTNRGIKVNYKITNILSTQSAKDFTDQ